MVRIHFSFRAFLGCCSFLSSSPIDKFPWGERKIHAEKEGRREAKVENQNDDWDDSAEIPLSWDQKLVRLRV